ncbi:MAG: GIY-YIG nuclease family protein [Chloroflexi bacterium]|nr:GIY-YIG nuclease family protein [Chloroflexota bacterium]
MSYWVYVLECADGTLYTGITTDPQRRLHEHQNGTAARYTRARRPVKLIGCREHADRASALRGEAAFKRLSRPAKLARLRDLFSPPSPDML